MFIVIFLRCDVQIKEHLDVYIFRKITEGHKFNVGKNYQNISYCSKNEGNCRNDNMISYTIFRNHDEYYLVKKCCRFYSFISVTSLTEMQGIQICFLE